ncbi:hypothetical protein Tco_1093880 [Tanacetum coccineum]|uniref:Uncharacterized protein n=1 Tax=Tanacetum coccineum TaxID=301880 RepID=A0ABQ5IGD0_9ASTR
MNQNNFEPNPSYSSFDQPPQYSINHQPSNIQENPNWQKIYELLQMMQSSCEKLLQQQQAADINQSPLQEMSIQDMENLKQHYLDEMLSLSNQIQIKYYRNEKIDIRFKRECEITIDELKGKFNGISIEINKQKELQYLEQVANLSTYPSQCFKSFCYDDNDDDYDYEESTIPLNEIESQIPPFIAITPEDSLSMRDEHLSTIPENESDKVIKFSVESLVLIPRESKDLTDYESKCDIPVCDVSSSKNEGLDDIEFTGKLAPINLIPLGLVETDSEEDIRLIEKLLNDDSSPYSPEELNSEIPDAIIESFSPSPIPIEDSDSLIEEINIFLALGDSIPSGIENDDYDSKGDILFLEELLNKDSLSRPEYETFHFDHYNVPSSIRPPKKPPDDDGIYFNIELDPGNETTKVVDDISNNSTRELYVHRPNVLPTHPTLYPVFDTLLPFSSENKDKVFNPRILISKEEKSPHLLSHRGFKVFQLINDFESPMMIYGGDIPILDVPYLHFYPP